MNPESPAEEQAPTGWIVSKRVDLAMILVPFAVTLALLAFPRPEQVGLFAFLFLVVAFDVSHVWATVYISYLDRESFSRRKWLFLLPIPLTVLVSFRLYLYSPMLFWSLMAYVAIHHFAAQQYGFIALYRLRGKERGDRYLDKWTLWVGALVPVLLWHTRPQDPLGLLAALGETPGTEQVFDWFGHGEKFLVPLHTFPPELLAELRLDLWILLGTFALLYSGRQLQHAWRGNFNWGKNLWMLGSWVSWNLGIALAAHPLVSLACINLFHGIPFLVLVWYRCHEAWRQRALKGEVASESAQQPWVYRLAQRPALWAFYGILLVLALAEEGLWEGLVWGNHLPRVELGTTSVALAVAVLSTPQIVHYYLDAWLWKLDGSNPDLHLALGVPLKS